MWRTVVDHAVSYEGYAFQAVGTLEPRLTGSKARKLPEKMELEDGKLKGEVENNVKEVF